MIPRQPPVDAHALARTILSERRFQVAVPSARATMWQLFWKWLHGWWSRLWDAIFSHAHIGKTASSIIGTIVALVLIALVVTMIARLALGQTRDIRSLGARPLEVRTDPRELYLQSRAAAAHGDYRLALALIFRAAVMRMHALGVARDDPSRTVNQWRRAIAGARPSLAPSFDAIARPFVAAVYAERPVGRDQWIAAENAYAALPEADARA